MSDVDELIGETVVKMSFNITSLGFLKYHEEDVEEKNPRRIIGALNLLRHLIRTTAKKRNNKKRELLRTRESLACQLRPSSYQTLMDKECKIEEQIKKYNSQLEKLYVQRDTLHKAVMKLT